VDLDPIELMQTADVKDYAVTDEFKKEGAYLFYKGTDKIPEYVASKNKFMVFFSGDAHKPGWLLGEISEPVLKLVLRFCINKGILDNN
jgi:beta-galactosidase beta subunit